MEGYRDPFNRACYPWGHEDEDLIAWYRYLGLLRQEHGDILKDGGLRSVYAHDNVLSFERYVETEGGEDALFVAVNRSMETRSFRGCILTMQSLFSAHRTRTPQAAISSCRRSASLCCASTAKKRRTVKAKFSLSAKFLQN